MTHRGVIRPRKVTRLDKALKGLISKLQDRDSLMDSQGAQEESQKDGQEDQGVEKEIQGTSPWLF